MAQCKDCGKAVSCSCTLIGGYCPACFSKNSALPPAERKKTARVVFKQPVDPKPNTEFEEILHTTGISREEKLRRINEILEKAKEQIST